MKKTLSLILAVVLLLASAVMLFSCTPGDEANDNVENEHQCEVPKLTEGENGNWWLGDEDTGIPVESATVEITKTESELVTIDGIEYHKVVITLSNGIVKEVLEKIPTKATDPDGDGKDDVDDGKDNEEDDKDDVIENFVTTASITNGYGGTNGIVCIMTDNDSGKFETIQLLDEMYARYGLVAGHGTVVKNLYADSEYKVPNYGVVDKLQEFLDTGRWKIINHTMTHTPYCDTVDGKKVVNEDKLKSELVTSIDHLRKLFPDQRVLTFAMTGTQSSVGADSDPDNLRAREREVIGENYIGGRFKGAGATAFDEIQWNNMPHLQLNRGSLTNVLNSIDAAAKDGKYFMVYTHYVCEDDELGTVYNESSWTNRTTAEALCARVSQYVKDGSVWCAHFEDAVMYMRERLTSTLTTGFENGKITILLTDKMDDEIFNHPLTLKLTVPEAWGGVKITQNGVVSYAKVVEADGERYVLANVTPDKGEATVESIAVEDIPAETKPVVKPTPDITIKVNAPDVYTFDDFEHELGRTISFNNAGKTSNKISVVTEGDNKVLKIEKSESGGNPAVTLAAKTLEGATSFILETKIKINQTNTSGESYVKLLNSTGKEAYSAFIKINSDGTMKLTDFNSGTTSIRTASSVFGDHKEYVNLKIVYTVVENKAAITVYADNTLILTSNNHYYTDSDPMTADQITSVRFNFSSSCLGELYIDDVVAKATN